MGDIFKVAAGSDSDNNLPSSYPVIV